MSIISINDLQKQSADQWRKLGENDDVIVTAQGEPVAVLMPISATNLEPTLAAIRSVRTVQAQAALQQEAEANGTAALSMDDINAEIVAARQGRHQK